jgi:hypothetical protein
MRIDIDFIPGSHGNYLEFVLTKLMLPDKIPDHPFNHLGASHNKNYIKEVFFAGHYSTRNKAMADNIISIRFEAADLLPLTSMSLLRARNCNISDDDLHTNTYNKLLNPSYKDTLKNILNSYKCHLATIDENNPDVPRFILREFFKLGFKNTSIHGFLQELEKMNYPANKNVYYFPYSSFLSMDKFLTEISRVGKFFNLDYQPYDLRPLHEKFLSNYQFISIKKIADSIVQSVVDSVDMPLNKLTLFQESYINAQLEKIFNIEMPFLQEEYFISTKEIIEYIIQKQRDMADA